jgi:hypothetical protein
MRAVLAGQGFASGRLAAARGLAARLAPVASRAATGLGIALAIFYWWLLTTTRSNPGDVWAYWSANPDALYPTGEDWRVTGYVYSPAFELVVGISRTIPFDIFVAIYRALLLGVLVYLAGPFTALMLVLFPVASEINAGNIQLLLALAVLASFRWPATWAFVILTKLTPGIGLLWFVLRRQWRHVAIALGVTGLIAAATAVVWPDRWAGYLHLLTAYPPPTPDPWYLPFWARLPFAVAILVVGAWRNWRWTVVAGSALALPVYWAISPAMLVGVLPYLRQAVGRWLGPAGDRRAAQRDRRSGRDRRAAADNLAALPERAQASAPIPATPAGSARPSGEPLP